MSTLYVTEFNQMPITTNGIPDAAMTPPIAEQTVAIGGTSAPSAAFNPQTTFVRIASDAVCSIAWAPIGGSPTATTANMRLPANAPEYFGVQPGGKLAVISNT